MSKEITTIFRFPKSHLPPLCRGFKYTSHVDQADEVEFECYAPGAMQKAIAEVIDRAEHHFVYIDPMNGKRYACTELKDAE